MSSETTTGTAWQVTFDLTVPDAPCARDAAEQAWEGLRTEDGPIATVRHATTPGVDPLRHLVDELQAASRAWVTAANGPTDAAEHDAAFALSQAADQIVAFLSSGVEIDLLD